MWHVWGRPANITLLRRQGRRSLLCPCQAHPSEARKVYCYRSGNRRSVSYLVCSYIHFWKNVIFPKFISNRLKILQHTFKDTSHQAYTSFGSASVFGVFMPKFKVGTLNATYFKFMDNVLQSVTGYSTKVCPYVVCFFGQNLKFWNLGEYVCDENYESVSEKLDIWHNKSLWLDHKIWPFSEVSID